MKLLMFTQYFPPETGAPQARLYELAIRLKAAGHQVRILTAMPNYPRGRVFDGYRGRLVVKENQNGLDVVRTAIWPSISKSFLPRFLSYCSFVLSSLMLGFRAAGSTEVVLLESPPIFLCVSGVVLSRLRGARLILMVSDIWPDILVRMGSVRAGPLLSAMLALESWAYRNSTLVAVTNPGARRQLRERFPYLQTAVISNGVDLSLFRPGLRSKRIRSMLGGEESTFLIGYCGLHGIAQGLAVVVDAAILLRHLDGVKFVMVGDGPTKQDLVDRVERCGLRNIGFYESRPKDEIPAIVASCDAGVVPLSCRLPGTMPSKVYEVLAAGTPVLIAKGCEGERLVDEHRVGMSFEPGSGRELADAIMKMIDLKGEINSMRSRCRSVAERFDRNIIAIRTERILLAVARGQVPQEDEE